MNALSIVSFYDHADRGEVDGMVIDSVNIYLYLMPSGYLDSFLIL